MAHTFGAALVVGCIDEDKLQAQAFTRERKLAVAQRSSELLTRKVWIPPEDIIIDPLVFPCATGDENYIGGAVETIEAHSADQRGTCRTSKPCWASLTFPLVCRLRCARSGEFGFPVLLHEGGTGSGDCERGKTGALRFDSRARAATGGESALFNTRQKMYPRIIPKAELLKDGSGGLARSNRENRKWPLSTSITSRPSRNIFATRKRQKKRFAPKICRSMTGWRITSSRAPRDGLIADLELKTGRGRGAAGYHQRSADERAWPKWDGCSTTTN